MEINDILFEDEQLLWTLSKEINVYKKIIYKTLRRILFNGILALMWLIMGIFTDNFFLFVFIAFFFIPLGISWTIFFQYLFYIRLKSALKVKKKDLKEYQESFYFTNRRCILKSYKIFDKQEIKLKKFPNHKIIKDYFILNHEIIKTILISVSSFKKIHTIYISEKEAHKYKDWESFFKIKIPSDKYNDYFEIMRNFLYLEEVGKMVENIKRYHVTKEISKNNNNFNSS